MGMGEALYTCPIITCGAGIPPAHAVGAAAPQKRGDFRLMPFSICITLQAAYFKIRNTKRLSNHSALTRGEL
jgi:hypothetical protein